MSGFKALNIESDDESDIEIDDTKEIQIEEALKLYQNALKYHAEGPESYERAAVAYQELFSSEIFKYPESQAELQRIELYGASESDDLWEDLQTGAVAVTGGLDIGPSTLPQILHLSHKNYAQFKLDALSAKFRTFNVTLNQILADATSALEHFVQALDKDDSDLDLWRRTASVGEILDSKRVARFCLESLLDDDDTGLSGLLSLPGLEESSAGEQLRELVNQLQDQLSVLQAPLSPSKCRIFSKLLKHKLHPYEDLLIRKAILNANHDLEAAKALSPQRLVLKTPSTWAELGDSLLRQLVVEQFSNSSNSPGLAISFDLTNLPVQARRTVESPRSHSPVQPSLAALIEPKFPTTMHEQFPGLDHGRPTVQPQIASADPSMQVASISPEGGDVEMSDPRTMVLPSRKRSGDAAGLADGVEEGRTKSRRIRARDSNADVGDSRQAIIDANTKWEYEQQLNEFQAADDWMYETVGNIFEKSGIVAFDAARHIRQEMSASADNTPSTDSTKAMYDLKHARSDIQSFLDKYSEHLAHALLRGGERLDLGPDQSLNGIGGIYSGNGGSKTQVKSSPLSDEGLYELLQSIEDGWYLTQEVAWRFIEALLLPGTLVADANSYIHFHWPENLKTVVVRTLVNFDDSICRKVSEQVESWRGVSGKGSDDGSLYSLTELTQTIFELHLDIYSLIKQPNSGVEQDVITAQGDRLQRWSDLTQELIHCRAVPESAPSLEDPLNIRFLWATTFSISASSDVSQDHIIGCMNNLRATLIAAGEPTFHLQNNAVLPELSVSALDREITKLTTKDFFLKVFSQDERDSASIIESLEPLLELLDANGSDSSIDDPDNIDIQPPLSAAPELVSYLEGSNISVRLRLWQRLRDAYISIDYQPMVLRCYLRMIRMILDELKSATVTSLAPAERQLTVLKRVRLLQDMVQRLFEIVRNSKDALDCVDQSSLKVAVTSFGEILQLLQVFNVAEDSIRVGQTQPPALTNGLSVPSFTSVTKMVHEMQIHIWTLLYALLKEAIIQNPDQYPTPLEDRFDFLRTVHRNLGIRGICGAVNRTFVRMLKDEFTQLSRVDGYDSEQAQVLYDLFRLNCFLSPSYELIEHNCKADAFLDRGVALQAADLLLVQASKLPVKDLVKHSLRDTIDKVHGSLPRKRPTEAILRNREIYRAFLRSTINPLDLYNCLKGEGNQLPVTPIPKEDALLASKGWYFLMGHMALTKFRSQKRTGPTATEDIDIAIAFFMQDLEYTGEHWETWFRLAQAYDTKIEENVVWSAEKLNNSMQELVTLQRHAIHCYTMATALAYRSAELTFETSDKMTELYYDFAHRLYSSAREPFGMAPFAVEDADRFVSVTSGVQKKGPFQALHVYTAVKMANALFHKALPGKPDNWMVHYMIGKCLWKMHAALDKIRPTGTAPAATRVIQSLVRAVDLLPEKEKKPDGKKEPVLEPDYKLVSVVHKLLTVTKTIDLQQAKEALSHTAYARKEKFPESMDEWVSFILAVLKNLRTADKANWYHRMIVRAAQISYEHSTTGEDEATSERHVGALRAKHELTQQMFTKTMVLQVWRPETERPGRHFVYTARYTRFFVKILEQLEDRANLEQLARRVRRRPHDIFEHSSVWQDICGAYLRLLRSFAALPDGLETSTFSNLAHEDFLMRKEPLEKWMQSQDSSAAPALDVLREVQELKRLNSSLMKPGAIDDLIGDAYAQLFNTIGKQLWEDERKAKLEAAAKLEAEKPLATSSPLRHHMMSLTNLMNVDGTVEAQTMPVVTPELTAKETDVVPTRRKIGVGRREIRTCAESCFQKSKAPSPMDVSMKIASAPRVQVIIERERPLLSGEASAETSAPGSIHDSADDESELSELEEAEDDLETEGQPAAKDVAAIKRRPMFPGLASVNAKTTAEDDGSETAESVVADNTEDVEMQDPAGSFALHETAVDPEENA